jgi:predicted phage terminase large subunit-like protein
MKNDVQAYFAAVRADPVVFLHQAFYELYPDKEFMWNWHTDAVVHVLEESLAGRHPRRIINLPPRQMKSLIVSVAWTAFLLGTRPTTKVIVVSYSEELAKSLSHDFNRLVSSVWYRQVFGLGKVAKSTQLEYVTDQGGYRFAVSVGGSLTGRGADLIVVDDPIKPEDALTQRRDAVNDWFRSTLLSRLDDKERGGLIIVMQRLHTNDLTGFAEAGGGFQKLALPAIARQREVIPLRNGQTYTREAGEALQPERESVQTLQAIRDQMGPANFAAQYQQDPASPDGAQFKRAWFQRIRSFPRSWLLDCEVYISIDAAASTAETADYTAISVVLVTRDKFIVVRAERGRWDYEQLLDRAKFWLRFAQEKVGRPVVFLIEAASAGVSLYQTLSKVAVNTGEFRCHYYRPKQGKDTRVLMSIPAFVEGRLYLQDLDGANDWVEPYVNEFLNYPKGRFDDQVDSLTQLISHRLPRMYANERPGFYLC